MTTSALHTDLEFQTPRLEARPLGTQDEGTYVRLYTDPATMRFVGPALSPQHAASSFKRVLDCNRKGVPNPLYMAVAEKATGCAVGICSLHRLDLDRGTVEAGIILLPVYQARGYAKEILPALVTLSVLRLPIDEVRVRISAAHSVVRRLVVGIGFMHRVDLQATAGSADLQVWSVHRHSWPTTKTSNERGDTDVGSHRFS